MSYIRKQRCAQCGEPHWFKYWVGKYCARSVDGLNVTDIDQLFHRFKRVSDALGTRDVEHLMMVEIKTDAEELRGPQRDTLSVAAGLLDLIVPVNGKPIGVKARPGFIVKGDKKIVWHGIHLVRVPRRESQIGPFFWDNKPIDSYTLAEVLNFDRDPRNPQNKLDIERRHKAKRELDSLLFPLRQAS